MIGKQENNKEEDREEKEETKRVLHSAEFEIDLDKVRSLEHRCVEERARIPQSCSRISRAKSPKKG